MVREDVGRQDGEEEVGKGGHDGGGTSQKKMNARKVMNNRGSVTEQGVTVFCDTLQHIIRRRAPHSLEFLSVQYIFRENQAIAAVSTVAVPSPS